MGSYGARIGLYWIDFHEYNLSDLPETSAKPDVFEKRKVDMNFIFCGTKHEERVTSEFKEKLTNVIPLKKERGRYCLDWDKFDLQKFLWDELKRREIKVFIIPYVVATNYEDPAKSSIYYCTQRRLGYFKEISLSSLKPAPIEVESYEGIKWCMKNNLRYDRA